MCVGLRCSREALEPGRRRCENTLHTQTRVKRLVSIKGGVSVLLDPVGATEPGLPRQTESPGLTDSRGAAPEEPLT